MSNNKLSEHSWQQEIDQLNIFSLSEASLRAVLYSTGFISASDAHSLLVWYNRFRRSLCVS